MVEPQTLRGMQGRHLNLTVNWQGKRFKALVDSGAVRNHIALATVARLGIPHRQKRHLYMLLLIIGEKVSYGGEMINLETGPVQLKIKGRPIKMSFDILPLGRDEAVLEMP